MDRGLACFRHQFQSDRNRFTIARIINGKTTLVRQHWMKTKAMKRTGHVFSYILASLIIFCLLNGCAKEVDTDSLGLGKSSAVIVKPIKNKPPIQIISREDGELLTSTITQDRNLRLYEQGGHCDCEMIFSLQAGKLEQTTILRRVKFDLENARRFIWNHWEQKQRGYIRLSFRGIDAGSTWHIFIEPDGEENWVVNIREVVTQAMEEARLHDLAKISFVERKRKSKNESELIFKDVTGTTIEHL